MGKIRIKLTDGYITSKFISAISVHGELVPLDSASEVATLLTRTKETVLFLVETDRDGKLNYEDSEDKYFYFNVNQIVSFQNQ